MIAVRVFFFNVLLYILLGEVEKNKTKNTSGKKRKESVFSPPLYFAMDLFSSFV